VSRYWRKKSPIGKGEPSKYRNNFSPVRSDFFFWFEPFLEKTLKAYLVALLCVIAAGCSTTANNAPETAASSREVFGMDWQWIVSRYNNGSEARPAEPALYLLRLEPDGSLRARVDCNRAGGRYRLGKHCKIGLIWPVGMLKASQIWLNSYLKQM